MKKKLAKKEEITNKDLARMIGGLGTHIEGLDSKFDGLTARLSKLEDYMRLGFDTLNHKMDAMDENINLQIEGLKRRIDDLADNKVSRITYKELESRVMALEMKVLPKSRK